MSAITLEHVSKKFKDATALAAAFLAVVFFAVVFFAVPFFAGRLPLLAA